MDQQIAVMNLEVDAKDAADEAGTSDHTWLQFTSRLELLKRHHLGMYAHSLRVGLYAYGIAKNEKWEDRRLPLMGGCGHDVGKCKCPVEILDSTRPLTVGEFEVIHRHPDDGYEILKDGFPFAAMIAGLHHRFTPKAYGIDLKDAPPWLQASHTHKIIEATMLVMLCDCWDAITTRRNASTTVDPDDTDGLVRLMSGLFPDWPTRITWLSENRSIFTTA